MLNATPGKSNLLFEYDVLKGGICQKNVFFFFCHNTKTS